MSSWLLVSSGGRRASAPEHHAAAVFADRVVLRRIGYRRIEQAQRAAVGAPLAFTRDWHNLLLTIEGARP